MCMLTRRTQILFEDENYDFLVWLANEQRLSVGELVRKAVKKTYIDDKEAGKIKRKKVFDNLLKWQNDVGYVMKGLNYKQLIEDGRNK
jgi:hypothetical protein